MEEAKIREGLEYMANGEKAINRKTFFGGKKPDFDAAASAYGSAATAFKLARAYDQAAEAYAKSADAQASLGSLFMAAKDMEMSASIAAQHMKRFPEAASSYQKASNFFNAHGSADRASECLEKAAKMMEPVDLERSIELYIEACASFDGEDRARQSVDTYKRTISMLIRNKRLDKALEQSSKLSDIVAKFDNNTRHLFFKNALSCIIIVLAMGDEVEAGKRLSNFASVPGFLESDESRVVHDLLDAYENHDAELLQAVQRKPTITYLDNEVAKLAMTLKVPGGGKLGVANEPVTEISALQQEVEEDGLL